MPIVLKLAALITFVFAACIGLIRVQPHDDSSVRAMLAPPDGCAMPCWQGIRPGVTTVDETRAILDAHEWIAEVGGGDTSLNARWSGAQPAWIRDTENLILQANDNTIRTLYVYTRIPLSEVWLRFGPPDRLLSLEDLTGLGSYFAIYSFAIVGFGVRESCSLNAAWRSDTLLVLSDEQPSSGGFEGSDILSAILDRCQR